MERTMIWAITVIVMMLPGCAKVGQGFIEVGKWVQGLDRTHTVEETTYERRRHPR